MKMKMLKTGVPNTKNLVSQDLGRQKSEKRTGKGAKTRPKPQRGIKKKVKMDMKRMKKDKR